MAVASARPLKYQELTLNLADVRETGKKLGEGSYGEVVEVMYLGTACAAKRIHLVWEQLGGKPEEEFKRECEIWSRLRHPNVVQLLGLLYKPSSGPATNLPTIVMEKMDCSLRHFVETHPRESIPLAVKVDVLYQVAQGLAYLHGQHPPVVHRDLSPNNILISLGSMTTKLSDFGVARVFHSQASRGTRVPGTQHFMPPETLPQALATERGYEDRIDVFSFGCIVICAVTHMWPEPLPPVQQTKAGKLVALTEVERRQEYINHFDPQEKTSFFRMVLLCLEFTPSKRPKSIALLKAMRELKDAHPLRAYFGLLQDLRVKKQAEEDFQRTISDLRAKETELQAVQDELDDVYSQLSAVQEEKASLQMEANEQMFHLQELQAVQDELDDVYSQLSAVQEEKASLQMEAYEQTFHQHQQLQEVYGELRYVQSQLSAMQEEKDCLLKELEAKEQILQQQQIRQGTALTDKESSTEAVSPKKPSAEKIKDITPKAEEKGSQHSLVTEEEKEEAGGRCTTGVQLALAAEKADTDKVEEKRSQLAPATEEEKEEGEITSDDESENIREGGHTEQEAGGCKKYDRDHLLSLRFLKECMEPPEGLFLPGALSLVRKTGGDIPGPMSAGYLREPRDLRDSRDDRYPGGRDKRIRQGTALTDKESPTEAVSPTEPSTEKIKDITPKAEEKGSQHSLVTEEEKEEAGGQKKYTYNRDQLLSMRFLKECMEPPEGLFLPGAMSLVRKTGGGIPGPMSVGYPRDPRDLRDPQDDRYTGGRGTRSHSRDGGRGSGPFRKTSTQLSIIDVPTHEKVELRKADVAWKRTAETAKELTEEEKETQDLYRKFQGILNKLTPQKFQKLAEQAKELMSTTATSQERMSGCIKKIFLMALKEPEFSVAYAKLCLVLASYKIKVGVNEDGTPKMKSFRALLLTKCQEEFEKDIKDIEELDKLKQAMEEAKTEEGRKQRKEVFEEAEFRSHHRSLGNFRFIGELFKLKLLSEAIMHECIMRLLRSSSDGESLECFAKLMSTIGKEMDHDKGKNLMEKYFNRVSHVIEARKIDSRVRFMLQDLVDLRQNAWVPRKLVATNVPTTIDKIHEQAKKEEMEMQKRIASQPMMGRPRGGGDGRRGRDEWSSMEHNRAPAPPTRIDAERFTRVMARAAGPTRLGPNSGWGKSQATSEHHAQKYQGIISEGKQEAKPPNAPPLPAGPRRSSSQFSDADSRQSVLETVAKQMSKLVQKAPPLEMVVSDALSDEEVERKSKTIVGELSFNGDYKKAQLCVSELRSPGKLHLFVNTVLNHTLETSSMDRQVAGLLLDQLLRERVLPVEAFMKGLNDVLEYAEDYECDVPKFWDYIAELLAPSVAHKGFPLVTLNQAHEGPLESGKIGNLVAKTLHKCTFLQGVTEDQVYDVWSQSGMEWSTHLHVHPEDLEYLLEDHKLTFLTQKPPARQPSSSGGVSQTARGDPKDWSRVLEEQMGSNHMTNDALFTYIETKHATEHKSPQFIFSLSSALTRAVVRGASDSAIFSEDLFRKRCPVLKKYVEGDPELQLQVIYGIQVTLAQKQHPRDVLCTMFNQLYDDDIVSDDTFYSWEETGREDLEGRAVTLVVARNFLQWLRSTGEEEGEGTVQ